MFVFRKCFFVLYRYVYMLLIHVYVFCALHLSLPTENPAHIRHSSDLFISTTKLYFIYLWDNCQYIVCVCMSE